MITIPPMPEVEKSEAEGNLVLQMYCTALENWGQECAAIANREAALADELAEALESLESLFDKMEKGFDYPAEVRFAARDAAKAAIQSHKEARNG